MRKIFTMVIATALSASLFAQSDVDALRYSMIDFGGTARSLGSGNAYGALGGDMSTFSMNPAGIEFTAVLNLLLHPVCLALIPIVNITAQLQTAININSPSIMQELFLPV